MRKASLFAVAVASSGLALACVTNEFRGAVIDVTAAAVAQAEAQGYQNPLRAAALAALDEWGSTQYPSRWRSEGFFGNFTYRVRGIPWNTVFDKPCGQMAVDEVPKGSSGSSGGVGDGSGSGSGVGGGGIIGGGGLRGGWACTSAGGGTLTCRFVLF